MCFFLSFDFFSLSFESYYTLTHASVTCNVVEWDLNSFTSVLSQSHTWYYHEEKRKTKKNISTQDFESIRHKFFNSTSEANRKDSKFIYDIEYLIRDKSLKSKYWKIYQFRSKHSQITESEREENIYFCDLQASWIVLDFQFQIFSLKFQTQSDQQ